MRSQLLRGSLWLSVGSASARILPLVVLYLVLINGEPAEYGQYALALAVTAVVTMAAEGGMTIFATSTSDIDLTTESALAWRAIRDGAVFYVVALLFGLCLSARDGYDEVFIYVAILGLTIPLAGYASLCMGRLQRLRMFRHISTRQAIGSAVGVAVGLAMSLMGQGVMSLVLQSVLSTGVTYLLFLSGAKSRISPKPFSKVNRSVARSLRYAVMANLVGVVGRRSDDLIIGMVLGPAALGVYALGYRVLMTLTELGLHPPERVTVSQLGAERLNRLSGAFGILRSNQRAVGVSVGPLFLAAGLGCFFVFPVALGDEWRVAGICALILCFGGAVQATFNLTFAGIYVLDAPSRAFRFQVIQVGGYLIPTFVGLLWGAVGASVGYLIGCNIGLLIAAWHRRALGSRMSFVQDRSTNVIGSARVP